MITLNQEKVIEIKRSRLAPLTKRQFNLYMFDHDLTATIDAVFAEYTREKIEFDGAEKFERNGPTVAALSSVLGWTEDQVDIMWEQALTL